MTFFLNELSFSGAFPTADGAVVALLKLYGDAKKLPSRLIVSRKLFDRPASGDTTVYGALVAARKEARGLLLSWLSRSGPFLEDEVTDIDDDLWWFEDCEVTELGLGEAARRLSFGEPATAISSSLGSAGRFDLTPLAVVQGFPDEPISTRAVDNAWTDEGLAALAARTLQEPRSWTEFLTQLSDRFPTVDVDAQNALDALKRHPYNMNVVRRSFALLDVLERVALGLQADGSLAAGAMELVTTHFQGAKAWFSDENPTDKSVFEFPDNQDNGRKVYCSWHGKIKSPQFRLHFQWPVPVGQRRIKVLYLGEKLTKA